MENIIRRIVIFLVRRKLHLKKEERFQFTNQKTSAIYWFTEDKLMKIEHGYCYASSVSLNWLLDSECKICSPDALSIKINEVLTW